MKIYDGTDPSKKQDFHDFLTEIFGIIGSDAKTDRKLGDIETDIGKIVDFDEAIAKILMQNNFKGGLEDVFTWQNVKYSKLATISDAVVSYPNQRTVSLYFRITWTP